MQVLSRSESSGWTILRNVSSKCIKLIDGTNKMVEPVLLPERTSPFETTVNFTGGKVLPGFALLEHAIFTRERRQQVNMVGHDHKVRQFVSFSVKLLQTVGDNSGKDGVSQNAVAMTCIQLSMPPI